jgi:hypothetical protein
VDHRAVRPRRASGLAAAEAAAKQPEQHPQQPQQPAHSSQPTAAVAATVLAAAGLSSREEGLTRAMSRQQQRRVVRSCLLLVVMITSCSVACADVCSILNGDKCVSDELAKNIRQFNSRLNTGSYDHTDYRVLREMMNSEGLDGKRVHVGHIVPNAAWSCDKFCSTHGLPDCRCRRHASCSRSNPLNCGWNLMAQPANENIWLKDKEVPNRACSVWGRDCSVAYNSPPVASLHSLQEL